MTVCETRIASAPTSIALREQHAVGHLAAEVVGLEGVVALEAVVAVVALEVEHRVDADAVRVRAGARADDDDRPAEVALGEAFDLVLAHVLDVEALALQRRRSRRSATQRPYITKYV